MAKKTDKKILTPSEYFDLVKGKRKTSTDETLNEFYDHCLNAVNQYKITGQESALKKTMFLCETVGRERKLLKLGINTFIYKDDVYEYVESVAKNVVKIIELKNYQRSLPPEIIELVGKTKGIFDEYYVVFTDYTGKEERRVEKERRDKDPILFGAFVKERTQQRFGQEFIVSERLYFIGDWVDEFCDLTLDKMIEEMKPVKNIEMTIKTPADVKELQEEMEKLDRERWEKMRNANALDDKKKTFFSKVATFLTRGKK